MKTRPFIFAGFAILAGAFIPRAFADTMSVPSADSPAYTLDVPSAWQPKLDKDDESVEAEAPDKSVYLLAWVVTKSDLKELSGDLASTLKDSMSSIDPGTKEESLQMNGVDYTIEKGSGIDKKSGGKVKFEVAIFPAGAGKAGIFYADYDADAPADQMDALQDVMKSIKVK